MFLIYANIKIFQINENVINAFFLYYIHTLLHFFIIFYYNIYVVYKKSVQKDIMSSKIKIIEGKTILKIATNVNVCSCNLYMQKISSPRQTKLMKRTENAQKTFIFKLP